MRKFIFGLWASLISLQCGGQHSQPTGMVADKEFDQEIASLVTGEIPFISAEQLYLNASDYVILDARNREEFETSHIPGAVFIGYPSMDRSQIGNLPKDRKIAVYCSVGYRSEKIGKKLREAGFNNVSNVYGSIFEWVNRGYPVVSGEKTPAEEVHTYNRKWSRWITNKKIRKVW